ncbi:MAG: hypothetical protein L0227_11875 [Chloroflexi bacterium]|nr:hypothetical protein [Chloroflexota bacterium]
MFTRVRAPEPRPDEGNEFDALRRRIALALGLMFAVAMAAAGPFIDWPFGRDGWVARLVALAIFMVVLARLVLDAARRLDAQKSELRDLYERPASTRSSTR